MKTVAAKTERKIVTRLLTGACALALTGATLLSGSPAYPAENSAAVAKANTQIAQNTQDQTAEKRKQTIAEAVSAVQETRDALKSLDDGKKDDALAALERATGKLDIILARDPQLALAPVGVGVVTYDVYGTIDAVRAAEKTAEKALEDGRAQEARQILKGLASETVISVTNIPLATYPAAIKEAARLIDNGKTEDAKAALQAALNTLVVTDTVVPLPVVRAQQFLKDAETLAEKSNRTDADNKRLTELLNTAQAEIKLGQGLGYGTRHDFDAFYKELDVIRDKTSNGKSGTGFFEKIKSAMTGMSESVQHDRADKGQQASASGH